MEANSGQYLGPIPALAITGLAAARDYRAYQEGKEQAEKDKKRLAEIESGMQRFQGLNAQQIQQRVAQQRQQGGTAIQSAQANIARSGLNSNQADIRAAQRDLVKLQMENEAAARAQAEQQSMQQHEQAMARLAGEAAYTRSNIDAFRKQAKDDMRWWLQYLIPSGPGSQSETGQSQIDAEQVAKLAIQAKTGVPAA